MEFSHRSVLLEPAVNALVDHDFGAKGKRGQASVGPLTQAHGVFVDGTFGRGGHSRYLLSRLSPQSTLVVFDKDPVAICVAPDRMGTRLNSSHKCAPRTPSSARKKQNHHLLYSRD